MAGFVIHLAVAQEYLKHNTEDNEKDFLYGSVQPDFVVPKSVSHYGKSPSHTNLKNFLLDNEIDTSLKRGCFLHLITDYLFYNHYLEYFLKPEIYEDYDILNKPLIEKYNVNVIDEVKEYMKCMNKSMHSEKKETKVLSYELACKVIDEVSKVNLEQVKQEALKDDKKWNTYKKLCAKYEK